MTLLVSWETQRLRVQGCGGVSVFYPRRPLNRSKRY